MGPFAASTLRGKRAGYTILQNVASGGFASVYFGFCVQDKTPVAVKILFPQWANNARIVGLFTGEFGMLRDLRHPNIVRVLDRGRDDDGIPFIAMEWVTGWTIAELIKRGRFPIGEAATIICQVLDGLEAVRHLERTIVHRDIKPDNIKVTPDGIVKVMDFGIAKESTLSAVSGGSQIMGTLRYMAPEQFTGDPLDCRTDLYAVGVTLYEMLAGRVPFEDDGTAAIMNKVLHDSPPPLAPLRPNVPDGLAAVVFRALEKPPSRRFSTPAEMRAALRPFADRPVTVPGAPPPIPTPEPPKDPRPSPPPPDRRPGPTEPDRPRGPVLKYGVLALALPVIGILLYFSCLLWECSPVCVSGLCPPPTPTLTSSLTPTLTPTPTPTLTPTPTPTPPPPPPPPHATIEQYYDLLKERRYDEAYELWTPSLKQKHTLDEYRRWFAERIDLEVVSVRTNSPTHEQAVVHGEADTTDCVGTRAQRRRVAERFDLIFDGVTWHIDDRTPLPDGATIPGDPCVKVLSVRVSPSAVRRGETLTLTYQVENLVKQPKQVQLGATLRAGRFSGSDPGNDVVVTVRPGIDTAERQFVLLAPERPVGRAHCPADQVPRFQRGLADLSAWLGLVMGEPVECEHAKDGAGNTEQATTTGLAYYRRAPDAKVFTNGNLHWAIVGSGRRVCWTTSDIDPPATARPEAECPLPVQVVLAPGDYDLTATINRPPFSGLYDTKTDQRAIRVDP